VVNQNFLALHTGHTFGLQNMSNQMKNGDPIECLFVGGPMHGQIRTVKLGQSYVTVEIQNLTDLIAVHRDTYKPREELYEYRQVRVEIEEKSWMVMVLDGEAYEPKMPELFRELMLIKPHFISEKHLCGHYGLSSIYPNAQGQTQCTACANKMRKVDSSY
jgi:hypothetical protein